MSPLTSGDLSSHASQARSQQPPGSFANDNNNSNFGIGLNMYATGGKYRGNLTRAGTTPFGGGTAVGSENN